MAGLNGTVTGADEIGVTGESIQFEGVRGTSHAADHGGVVGINDNSSTAAGPGVFGESKLGEGVRGISHSPDHGGVVGINESANGVGIFAKGGRLAGQFAGAVEIDGVLTVQGSNVLQLMQQLQANQASNAALVGRIASLESRANTLQLQVNTMQGQLTALQTKETQDVEGIVISLVTLASRVTALGG